MFAARLASRAVVSLSAVVLIAGLSPSRAIAQAHLHAAAAAPKASGALVDVVRAATERYKDVAAAEADGYALQFGCVTGGDIGAMGMHFVNGPLVMDGELDPRRPEIVIYEPTPNGGLRLIGADYLVIADAWNAKHSSPPEIMGQLLHLFEAPNRFGLPAFYTLHVWAWKDNPAGTFVNWHTNVSCNAFDGQSQD